MAGKSSTISTQTEWSWIQDLNVVGRNSIPVPDSLEKEQSNKLAITNEENLDEATRNEEDSVEIELAHSESDVSIEERADEENDSRGRAIHAPENEYENNHTPVEVLDDPADDLSLFDSDSDSLSGESLFDDERHFPSVGPPQMLEFLRETNSEKFTRNLEDIPFDTETGFHKSFFSGPCQFCSEKVLPLPTVQQIETLPSSKVQTF